MLLTTSFYAALLTLFYIGLSINVIHGRRHHAVSLGDGNINAMKTKIRAHGNFSEYAPLFIILLAMAEYQGLPNYGVHSLGILFIVGRLFHTYSLLITEPSRKWFKPRITGMAITFTCLSTLAIILLFQILK